jgi:hypothetical protein
LRTRSAESRRLIAERDAPPLRWTGIVRHWGTGIIPGPLRSSIPLAPLHQPRGRRRAVAKEGCAAAWNPPGAVAASSGSLLPATSSAFRPYESVAARQPRAHPIAGYSATRDLITCSRRTGTHDSRNATPVQKVAQAGHVLWQDNVSDRDRCSSRPRETAGARIRPRSARMLRQPTRLPPLRSVRHSGPGRSMALPLPRAPPRIVFRSPNAPHEVRPDHSAIPSAFAASRPSLPTTRSGD